MSLYACRNGEFLPEAQVSISLLDLGWIWGAVVTDAVRPWRGELFRWVDHVARFRESCRLAAVPLLASDEVLLQAAQELIRRNAAELPSGQELLLILLATPGVPAQADENQRAGSKPEQPGDLSQMTGPCWLMHTRVLEAERLARIRREGVVLRTARIRAPSIATIPSQVKHRSRLHWWLAEREVQTLDPQATALLLDDGGFVTETWNANVLLVRQGQIFTPPRRSVLPGVTRQVVEELCRELGLSFAERPCHLVDLPAVEEAILTCTSYSLAPVRQIEEIRLPCPGPVFARLSTSWQRAGFPW